jgi:hypothetical protein
MVKVYISAKIILKIILIKLTLPLGTTIWLKERKQRV